MGGSGGGGAFVHRSSADLAKLVRETEDQTAIKAFETDLNGFLAEKLASANSRDVDKVAERLGDIKAVLGAELEGTVDSLFGGSVARHTYVDGLSDIDSLLILDPTNVKGQKPSDLIAKIAKIVRDKLPGSSVKSGRLAVTVTYGDGMEIQLLPSTRVDGVLRVPSFRRDVWSKISPEGFQKELNKRNDQCGKKLVPTIKLAKQFLVHFQNLKG